MARIYLAGAESVELLHTLIENGGTSIMLSFFYVQQRGALPQILKLLKQHPHLKVFMDSGSQSFAKRDHGDPQPYWKAYYDLLRQHGHCFEYASEFDIDTYAWKSKGGATRRVKDEQLEVWRDDLAELQTVPIVPVWRPDRGPKAFDAFLNDARFPHVAFSRDAGISRGEAAKYIGRAHAWNTTVHGFGQSALDELRWLKFDTVSSTTWLAGQKYGDAFIFEGGHLRRIYASAKKGKSERKKYRRYFERIGVDPDKIEQDDRKELNKANILAWMNLSKRLELIHPHKGPQRFTGAPGASSAPEPSAQAVSAPALAVRAPTAVLEGVPNNGQTTRMIPVQPVESVTLEKTEEPSISIPVMKPFMPPNAPPLMCSACALSVECPKFQEAAVCAYREEFSKVTARDANEVVDQLASIFALNVERGRYLQLAEQITGGGMVNPDVTKHHMDTFTMGAKLAELMKGKKSAKASMQGGGVVSRLFAGIGAQPARQLSEADNEHELPVDDENEPEVPNPDEDTRTARQRRQAEHVQTRSAS